MRPGRFGEDVKWVAYFFDAAGAHDEGHPIKSVEELYRFALTHWRGAYEIRFVDAATEDFTEAQVVAGVIHVPLPGGRMSYLDCAELEARMDDVTAKLREGECSNTGSTSESESKRRA